MPRNNLWLHADPFNSLNNQSWLFLDGLLEGKLGRTRSFLWRQNRWSGSFRWGVKVEFGATFRKEDRLWFGRDHFKENVHIGLSLSVSIHSRLVALNTQRWTYYLWENLGTNIRFRSGTPRFFRTSQRTLQHLWRVFYGFASRKNERSVIWGETVFGCLGGGCLHSCHRFSQAFRISIRMFEHMHAKSLLLLSTVGEGSPSNALSNQL